MGAFPAESTPISELLVGKWMSPGSAFDMDHVWKDVSTCILDSPFSNIDGVFVRSLLGLLRMACEVQYVVKFKIE